MDKKNEYLNEFQMALGELGIQSGDILYVASDITLLLNEVRKHLDIKTSEQRNEFLGSFVDCFQHGVGENGTLLFPVFTWDFCKGRTFSVLKTQGETGALSNWILNSRKDFLRTRHPIYSFMVWGKDGNLLKTMKNKSSWGADSPFFYLHHHKAKLLLCNVSLQRGFTFMHYVEESIKVPYRYQKDFTSSYIDEDGHCSEKTYSMYVRDLDIQSEEYLPESFLDERNITKNALCGKMHLKVIDLEKAYAIVADDLKKNRGRNCRIFHNYEMDWTKGATHDDEVGYRLS